MNKEFWISTILAIIGIVLTLISMGFFKKKSKRKEEAAIKAAKELNVMWMKATSNKKEDKFRSNKERQELLRSINKLLPKDWKIKSDYIDNFDINRVSGPEVVLKDMCIQSNLDPNIEILSKLLGYSANKISEDLRNAQKETILGISDGTVVKKDLCMY